MYHDRLFTRMRRLGIRSGVVAAVCDVPAPKLSNFFSGKCELTPERRNRIDRALRDLTHLQECFPVPLGLTDAKQLKLALARYRAGLFSDYEVLTKSPEQRWNVVPV